MSAFGKMLSQQSSVIGACLLVPLIFDVVGDVPESGIIVIEEQGTGIGIPLESIRLLQFLLQKEVELVCHRVVAAFPETGQRQFRSAVDAKLSFV
jgi:hypothetical protein